VTRGQISPERPGDVRYKDRRLLALYFDMSAMPVPDQLRAQSAAVKFIRTQMAPPDLMAILSFSDGVHVLRDFTDNRDDLEKTIYKLFVGEAQGFDFTDADDSSADTGTAFGEDDSEFNLFNTDRQLAALQTAAKMLGALNEKKVLIYFASGLRLSGVDNQAQFQATTNAAIRANVSLYSIDARGLVAQAPLGDATRGSPGGIGMYSAARRWPTPTTFRSRRIRCTRWRRIRAGRRCWTTTTCRWESCGLSSRFRATTFSATTRPTRRWTGASAGSRLRSTATHRRN
jgi:VWFA-related protein